MEHELSPAKPITKNLASRNLAKYEGILKARQCARTIATPFQHDLTLPSRNVEQVQQTGEQTVATEAAMRREHLHAHAIEPLRSTMLPLEISARGFELSGPAQTAIRERGAKLKTFFDKIMACRVAVDMPRRRGTTGQLYNVRIDITLPGKEIVVKRKPHEALLTAIQEAFDAAERRLRRHAQRRRGEVKQHEEQPHGWVRELYPTAGYGFLEGSDGTTYYFDERSVLDGAFSKLDVGSRVRFARERGDNGPQASSVVSIDGK